MGVVQVLSKCSIIQRERDESINVPVLIMYYVGGETCLQHFGGYGISFLLSYNYECLFPVKYMRILLGFNKILDYWLSLYESIIIVHYLRISYFFL